MATRGTAVHQTSKQPLYLQHQGHSRTVVGVDMTKNGNWLLIFDPSKSVSSQLRLQSLAVEDNSNSKTSLVLLQICFNPFIRNGSTRFSFATHPEEKEN